MIQFLMFCVGQLIAIGIQWTFWMNETRAWGTYWSSRRHQAQHVRDFLFSVVAVLMYGAGVLRVALQKLGVDWLTDAIPDEIGWGAAGLAGFGFCFLTRHYAKKKWFDSEPDEPPTPPSEG